MPVNLNDLLEPSKSATIAYEVTDGNTVEFEIKYKPSAFTPLLESEFRKITEGEAGTATDASLKMLSALVSDLGMVETVDGKDVPITPTIENLSNLPFRLLVAILTAVTGDMSPKETSDQA